MTRCLDNSTVLIVAGRSLSTFHLQRALEREGAAVCVTSLSDAPGALRNARPDAAVIDFSLAARCDDLAFDLETSGIMHLLCSSPNRTQSQEDQIGAAQDVAASLSDLIGTRGHVSTHLHKPALDAELYAI